MLLDSYWAFAFDSNRIQSQPPPHDYGTTNSVPQHTYTFGYAFHGFQYLLLPDTLLNLYIEDCAYVNAAIIGIIIKRGYSVRKKFNAQLEWNQNASSSFFFAFIFFFFSFFFCRDARYMGMQSHASKMLLLLLLLLVVVVVLRLLLFNIIVAMNWFVYPSPFFTSVDTSVGKYIKSRAQFNGAFYASRRIAISFCMQVEHSFYSNRKRVERMPIENDSDGGYDSAQSNSAELLCCLIWISSTWYLIFQVMVWYGL